MQRRAGRRLQQKLRPIAARFAFHRRGSGPQNHDAPGVLLGGGADAAQESEHGVALVRFGPPYGDAGVRRPTRKLALRECKLGER